MSLSRLFRPQSIAVFGGGWAENVVEQCLKFGYEGAIWPVHPTRESMHGIPCFRSVHDLPAAPDASFVGVNRQSSIEVVRALAELGCGGVVCFASGFSEALKEDPDGQLRQAELVEAAGSMPFLGPNCYGFINCLDGALLWPDQHGAQRVDRGVAILTQSSNIAINLTMQTRGLPIAYVLTAGNQAKITLAQQALEVLEDERVTALGLHIEGFSSIPDMQQLARRAREVGKPIVAIKVGRTDYARSALVSHTSSLAGSEAASDAFLERLGMASVSTLSHFLETLKLMHVRGLSVGRRALSMSCSGGEACLVSDIAAEFSVKLPALQEAQIQDLRQALGPMVALANPLDYHTYIWNDAEAMQAMFKGMLNTQADIALLVLDFPRADRCTFPSWLVAVEAFKRAAVGWPGALAVVASLSENMPEAIAEKLMAANVVAFAGLQEAMAAIDAATSVAERQQQPIVDVLLANEQLANDLTCTPAVVTPHNEASAKSWLQGMGFPVPPNSVFNAAQHTDSDTIEAWWTAQHQLSFPCVVKQLGVAHKSEVGGVVLGITDIQTLCASIKRLSEPAGCLVEQQIDGVIVELLVGVVYDTVHGFLMSVGRGGVSAELQPDVCHVLLPVDKPCLLSMLSSLHCFPLMCGYRGNSGINMDALVDVLMLVQQAVLNNADTLLELEINPLLCRAEDVIVVDALLQFRNPL